ncbi:c-type cytochrome [Devosia nitrariae]|uniref:Cytochrome c domain-containing protein n=1 Tax=Devosia nitrariae TaxID=2071872 RepID=A0ABQ5W5Z3_9HYPH|nr:cytochrome c [Devosia nitrariae]GLQ55487.1 hypothetical protein GCM10010862_27460 [Devosia nitrariae]
MSERRLAPDSRVSANGALFISVVCGLALAAGLLQVQLQAQEPAEQDAEAALSEEEMDVARQLITSDAGPACAVCHQLAAAEATGTLGPSLDQLKPDAQTVRAALLEGPGVMPEYGDKLTMEQMELISAYVAAVAGGGQP